MDIFQFRMCQSNHLVNTDICAKFYVIQVVNLALNEIMSFEILRMSFETSLIWQSCSLVRDSGSKGGGMYAPPYLTS